ncbi:TRAP transporter permease [Natrialbaceae archaeon GCM10025810]|uniref:TRAP transporter permease n=1 Tax=Halovalidus salilacus TaxID=3075124 RepID=UPI00360829BF
MTNDSLPDDVGAADESISQQERDELVEELEQKRSLRGISAVAISVIGICFSLFQLYIAARGPRFVFPNPLTLEWLTVPLQSLQYNAIHVSFGLVIAFLLFPPSTGDGAIARRLGCVVPTLERRFGPESPLVTVATHARGVIRWSAIDPDRERVTPVDVALIATTVTITAYMLGNFDEIQSMRTVGLSSGRPIHEIYTFLEPIVAILSAVGIPLGEISGAYLLGILGVLLVLEATRRALGIYLMALVSLFIVYARFGSLIPRDGAFSLAVDFGVFSVDLPTIVIPLIDIFAIGEFRWDQIVEMLWYTGNGIFGVPVRVSVEFIYIFILFGAFLEMSGAGKWFIELAYSLTAGRKGGPAKASIVASGFMGMISGSSIANTVTTGAFTIPLMKRTGYDSEFAGGVEAAASSGGQILPPVMGAAAFLIVEYTGIPYQDVIVAALAPAIVFFFGVWVMVHLKASKEGISASPDESAVDVRPHLKQGWFYLAPVIALLYYLLIANVTEQRAAWYTIVVLVGLVALVTALDERNRVPLLGTIAGLFGLTVASFALAGSGLIGTVVAAATGAPIEGVPLAEAFESALKQLGWIALAVCGPVLLARPYRESPLLDLDPSVDEGVERVADAVGLSRLEDNRGFRFAGFTVRSMDSGARVATTVVIAVAAAGIIPGILGLTGLGPNLTSLIREVSGGSQVLLLTITAISSIILGMGMPTTVTYIILVSMLGPAIEGTGIPLLAAHLFILYFGVIADITPPVAVAAYAAAGVAKADQFVTGIKAFVLSLNKVIVPFAFVFAPGVLLLRDGKVIGFSDVADLGFFLPEVVVPIVGLFLGVVALGPTIVGYYYARVTHAERALFAISSVLLMAPLMVHDVSTSLLAAAGVEFALPALAFDLALRVVGLSMFVTLTLTNKGRPREPIREPDNEVTQAT